MVIATIEPNPCRSCKHATQDANEWACRRYPPTVFPYEGRGPNGQEGLMKLVMYPKVEPNWSCGEYAKGILRPGAEPLPGLPGGAILNGG